MYQDMSQDTWFQCHVLIFYIYFISCIYSFLEPTSAGVTRNHGLTPCGVRTHDPEVARQTSSSSSSESLLLSHTLSELQVSIIDKMTSIK